MNLKRKMRKGFTLVELVVVIAVIAVLAAVSVGAYFGVTDSAKSSNAQSYLKQIKDMWMVFTVSSDYDENLSEQDNAEFFAAEYIPYNGLTVDLNYRMVNYHPNGITNAQNSEVERAVLFKIEYDYSSWFIVFDKNIVAESEIYKSEDSFVNSLVNFNKISGDYDGDGFTSDTFYLCTMIDSTNPNHKVRGYKYVEYVVKSYDVNENLIENSEKVHVFNAKQSLYNEIDRPQYNPNQTINVVDNPSYPENEKMYVYKDGALEKEFNTDIPTEIGNVFTKQAEINGNKLKRAYVCDTIEVAQISNIKLPTTDNYPVLYVNNSSNTSTYKFYQSLDALIDAGSLVENNNSNRPSLLFIGTTKLSSGKTLNVPNNHKVIVDFLPVVLNENNGLNIELDDFNNINSLIENRITNAEIDSQRVQSSQVKLANGENTFRMGDSDQRDRTDISKNRTYNGEDLSKAKYTFTIEDGAEMNFQGNSMLFSEAKISLAAAQTGSGILDHSLIVNNGSMNFYSTSKIRSLGRIDGSGSINLKDKSILNDFFKLTSFFGGTISVNMYTHNIFPFNDYVFDNIHCETNMYNGSSYAMISGATADDMWNDIVLKYISPLDNDTKASNNSLLMYENIGEDNLVAKVNYLEKENIVINDSQAEIIRKVKTIEFKNSNYHLRNVTFNMGSLKGVVGVNINSALYNFPVANTDFIIDETSTFNIGENTTITKCDGFMCKKYIGGRSFNLEFLPSSSLTIKGTLNLSASTGSQHEHLFGMKGQTDIERSFKLGSLSFDAETLIGVKDQEKTELSFQNFTREQLDQLISSVVKTNSSLEENLYIKEIFQYYKDNLYYWQTEREMLNIVEEQSNNIKGSIIFDNNAKVLPLVDIYAANQFGNFVSTSNSYQYKYLTAFAWVSSDNIADMMKGTIGEAKTFALSYSYPKN